MNQKQQLVELIQELNKIVLSNYKHSDEKAEKIYKAAQDKLLELINTI